MSKSRKLFIHNITFLNIYGILIYVAYFKFLFLLFHDILKELLFRGRLRIRIVEETLGFVTFAAMLQIGQSFEHGSTEDECW